MSDAPDAGPGTAAHTPHAPQVISLNRVLLGAIALTVLVGLVPTGFVLDRRLARGLADRARADLERAPALMADRSAAYADAQMMHAKEFAHAPGLAAAVARGDRPGVMAAVEASRPSLGAGLPFVIAGDSLLLGPRPAQTLIHATQRGEMPVAYATAGQTLHSFALAPLEFRGRWVGAAGVATPFDDGEAERLSGVTRSDVLLVLSQTPTSVTASTLDSTATAALGTALARAERAVESGSAFSVRVGDDEYVAVRAPLASEGTAFFLRRVQDDMAVLPALRRTAAASFVAAIAVALALGWWLSRRVSLPVQQLAAAADALRAGHMDAPMPASRIAEVARVAERFDEMRRALATRLAELRETNAALQDRTARLSALQSDLMQRERRAAAGRLVAQLAHEIRNPVASLRNCLEVVRRRVQHDPEALEFADLAIDEVLRMHELAEQMLDVNRPRDAAHARSAPVSVVRDVIRLVTAGQADDALTIDTAFDDVAGAEVPLAADALKQVLLNLVQNAREAVLASPVARPPRVRVVVAAWSDRLQIRVEDNGPGVPPDLRDRIFDPFVTTKRDLQGVGLGLFVAEGLVRGCGGRMAVGESSLGGAAFVVDLPRLAAPAVTHSRDDGPLMMRP